MLEIRGLVAGYGNIRVLHGVDLDVAPGEVVAVLGRNGMGKTTLLRAVMGLCRRFSGKIRFAGRELDPLPTERRARLGIGWVPETRDVFPSLTVEENLRLAAAFGRRDGPFDLAAVYRLFPRLRERAAHPGRALSGGEQQMLAIARALVQNPALLLLDEPTEGLAPAVVREIGERLAALRDGPMAVLLVERNLAFTARLARRALVLERGRLVWQGSIDELTASGELAHSLLGVAGRNHRARAGPASS